MTKRKRDYPAEYARRIAKGLSQGRTRAQSRGHPAVGQDTAKSTRPESGQEPKLEHAFRLMRDGKSLVRAAKAVRVAPERLRRYLAQQGIAERKNRRWVTLEDKRRRRMLLYSDGEEQIVTVGLAEGRTIGAFMSAVRRFLEDNDRSHIAIFDGGTVVDVRGVVHPFDTTPNTLYRLAQSGGDSFENIYRIIR